MITMTISEFAKRAGVTYQTAFNKTKWNELNLAPKDPNMHGKQQDRILIDETALTYLRLHNADVSDLEVKDATN